MMSSLGLSKLFSMPKCGGVQLHLRIRNSPDALALGDAGLLTYDSTWRVGPLYRRVRRVVNRSAQLGGPQFSLQIRAQYSKLPIRLLPRDYELPTKRISLLATNPNLS